VAATSSEYVVSSEKVINKYNANSKDKTISVTGRESPEGCEMSTLQRFVGSRLEVGSEAVRLSALRADLPPFTPWKFPGTHFS
jgi:hypothetical protein